MLNVELSLEKDRLHKQIASQKEGCPDRDVTFVCTGMLLLFLLISVRCLSFFSSFSLPSIFLSLFSSLFVVFCLFIYFSQDVENSTPLWEHHSADMNQALQLHDQLIRTCLADCYGFVTSVLISSLLFISSPHLLPSPLLRTYHLSKGMRSVRRAIRSNYRFTRLSMRCGGV